MRSLRRLIRSFMTHRDLRDYLRFALIACLIAAMVMLGGASRDHGMNAPVLNLISTVILLPALLLFEKPQLTRAGWLIAAMIAALVLWNALMLVPIPFALWAELPGREDIASAYLLLDERPDTLPISLTPDESLRSLLGLLPSFVLALLILPVTHRRRARLFLLFLLTGAICLVSIIGLVQYVGEGRALGYFYRFVNEGFPLGPFANANHFSIFLIAGLPFVGALIAEARKSETLDDHRLPVLALALLATVLIVLGVALAQSFAGYLLLIPSLMISIMLALSGTRMSLVGRAGGLIAILAAAFAIIGLYTSPNLQGLIPSQYEGGVGSRSYAAALTIDAIKDFTWLGSGLGSYEEVIATKEKAAEVTATFLPHAHNDYLQIMLESGIAGGAMALLIVAMVIWAAITNLLGSSGALLSRAAGFSILIVMFHSTVDYPLRTQAASVILIIALAMLFVRRQ